MNFVAVDLPRDAAQRIQRLVQEELFYGVEDEDEQPFECFIEAVERALRRQHDLSDGTGHCTRCGAEPPGPCSGGA